MSRKYLPSIFQFIKFCSVGVLNTLITLLAIDIFGDKLGLPYDIANLIGYVLGFINSFILNKLWTFKSRKNPFREGLFFIAAFVISYGIQFGILKLTLMIIPGTLYLPITDTFKFTLKYAQIIALAFYTASNFLLNKYISFRKTNKQ